MAELGFRAGFSYPNQKRGQSGTPAAARPDMPATPERQTGRPMSRANGMGTNNRSMRRARRA